MTTDDDRARLLALEAAYRKLLAAIQDAVAPEDLPDLKPSCAACRGFGYFQGNSGTTSCVACGGTGRMAPRSASVKVTTTMPNGPPVKLLGECSTGIEPAWAAWYRLPKPKRGPTVVHGTTYRCHTCHAKTHREGVPDKWIGRTVADLEATSLEEGVGGHTFTWYDTCPGEGVCHGSLSWCDACDDVTQVCDAAPGDCDCHCRCTSCNRRHGLYTQCHPDHCTHPDNMFDYPRGRCDACNADLCRGCRGAGWERTYIGHGDYTTDRCPECDPDRKVTLVNTSTSHIMWCSFKAAFPVDDTTIRRDDYKVFRAADVLNNSEVRDYIAQGKLRLVPHDNYGPIMCGHANENPSKCSCDTACYCYDHTCRTRCTSCKWWGCRCAHPRHVGCNGDSR